MDTCYGVKREEGWWMRGEYSKVHPLYRLYSFMTMALEGGEGSASCPSHSLPLGKTWYPLYRKLVGP